MTHTPETPDTPDTPATPETPRTGEWTFWKGTRVALLALSAALVVVVFVFAFGEESESQKQIKDLRFSDPVKLAIDNKLATSRSFFQAALLAGGVLWGLIIGKTNEMKIVMGDWPEQ